MLHDNTNPATSGQNVAEGKVLAVLHAHPNSTVAEIAAAAGVGRSTAGKILVAAEQAGRARRSPGSAGRNGRSADRWRPATPGVSKPARLGRGALRDMVAEYLAAHPGQEFGPTAIGKALVRSTGAVANALDALVLAGHATRTGDRPARYTTTAGDQSNTNAGLQG